MDDEPSHVELKCEQSTAEQSSVDPLGYRIDERVRFALAAARMGVFDWDPTSDVLRWSSSTTGLGLSLEQAPTSGRAFFELVHPDDRLALRETRARALLDRTDAVSEFRIVGPDGGVHWVQGHGRVVYDASGEALRVVGVNTEITHRKSLEEQLRAAHVEVARLHVLKATMRTVQDIVGNALMSFQLFRFDAEPYVPAQSLKEFDQLITTTAKKLRALGDLDRVIETKMAVGTGIAYPSGQPSQDT
jgi:PAS domain S-box-containing protein